MIIGSAIITTHTENSKLSMFIKNDNNIHFVNRDNVNAFIKIIKIS